MIDQDMLNAISKLISENSAVLEKRITEQTLSGMRVILENEMQGQINLIYDEIKGIREALIAPQDVDALDDRVSVLETAVCVHNEDIQALKKAQ